MSDASGGDPRVHNLTSEEVARGLQEGRMLLVDVREPNEVDAEAYPDAVVVPLSSFDPAGLPPHLPSGGRHSCGEGRGAADGKLNRPQVRVCRLSPAVCATNFRKGSF